MGGYKRGTHILRTNGFNCQRKKGVQLRQKRKLNTSSKPQSPLIPTDLHRDDGGDAKDVEIVLMSVSYTALAMVNI